MWAGLANTPASKPLWTKSARGKWVARKWLGGLPSGHVNEAFKRFLEAAESFQLIAGVGEPFGEICLVQSQPAINPLIFGGQGHVNTPHQY